MEGACKVLPTGEMLRSLGLLEMETSATTTATEASRRTATPILVTRAPYSKDITALCNTLSYVKLSCFS